MRLFYLVRSEDVSGISGVGRVCEGVEFDDGQCVLSWMGQFHSVAIYPNLKAVVDVHGHNGKTWLEWLDGISNT